MTSDRSLCLIKNLCASSAQDNNISVPHQPWITISCHISAVFCQALESKFSSHLSRYFWGKLLASTPIALVLQRWVRSSPCVYKSICKANKMSLYCHLPSSLPAWKRGEKKSTFCRSSKVFDRSRQLFANRVNFLQIESTFWQIESTFWQIESTWNSPKCNNLIEFLV